MPLEIPNVPAILAHGIYDDDLLFDMLGLGRGTLAEARRRGVLKFTMKDGEARYLGDWVLTYLYREYKPPVTSSLPAAAPRRSLAE